MKVLLLGDSQDLGAWFDGGQKRHEIVQERLAQDFGEPVDIAVKSFWPNERMPALLDRWITETAKDLVYINVTAFPFSYESLPLRLDVPSNISTAIPQGQPGVAPFRKTPGNPERAARHTHRCKIQSGAEKLRPSWWALGPAEWSSELLQLAVQFRARRMPGSRWMLSSRPR